MSNVTATLGGTPTSLSSVANVPPVDTIVIASKDHQLGSYSATIQSQLLRGGSGFNSPSRGAGSVSPRRPGPSEDPILLLHSRDSKEKRKLVPAVPPPPFSPNMKRAQVNLSPRNLGIPPDPMAIQQAVDDENWSLRDDDGPVKCAPVTAFDEERFRNYVRQQRTVLRHTHTPRRIKADEFVPTPNISTHRRGDFQATAEVPSGSVSTSMAPKIPSPPLSAPTTTTQPRMKASDYHGKQDLLESLQPRSMKPSPIQHKRHHLAVLTDYMTQAERENLAAEIRHELHAAQLSRRGQQFQRRRKEYEERVHGNTIAADRNRNDNTDPTSEVLEALLPTEITFYVKNPDCNVRGKEYLRLPVPNSHGIKRIIDEQASFLTKTRNPYNLKGATTNLTKSLHGTIYPDFKLGDSTHRGGGLAEIGSRSNYFNEDHTGDTTSEDDDAVDITAPVVPGSKSPRKPAHNPNPAPSQSIHDDRDPSRSVVLSQLKTFTKKHLNSKTGEYRPTPNQPSGSVTGVLKSVGADGKHMTETQLNAQRVQGVRAARRTSAVQRVMSFNNEDPNLERALQRKANGTTRRDAPFLFNTQPPTSVATSHTLAGVSFGNGSTTVPILEGVLLFTRLYESLNGSSAGTPGVTAACKEMLLLRLLDSYPALVSSVITKRAFFANGGGAGGSIGSAEVSLAQFLHHLAVTPAVRMKRLPTHQNSSRHGGSPTKPRYTLGTPVVVGAVVSVEESKTSASAPSRMHPGKSFEISGIVGGIVGGGSVSPRTVLKQQKDMIASRKMGSFSMSRSAFLPTITDRGVLSSAGDDSEPQGGFESSVSKAIYPDSMVVDGHPTSGGGTTTKAASLEEVAAVRPWESLFRIVDSNLSGSAPRELLLLGIMAAASAVPRALDTDPTAYRVDVSTSSGCIRGLHGPHTHHHPTSGDRSPIRQQRSIRTDTYDTLTFASLWVVCLLSLRAQQDVLPLAEVFAIRDALNAVSNSETKSLDAYKRGRQNALLLNGGGGSAPSSARRKSPPRTQESTTGAAVTAHQHLSSTGVIDVIEAACEHAIQEHRLLGCGELADAILSTLTGKEPAVFHDQE